MGAIYNDFTEKWHVLAVDFEQDDSAAGSEFARIGELLRLMSGDDVHPSNPAWVHSGGSFSQRIAEPFIMGRAALAGDAAHVFSSLAGQGLHFAIEDALNPAGSSGWRFRVPRPPRCCRAMTANGDTMPIVRSGSPEASNAS